jgi:hypothetical protein
LQFVEGGSHFATFKQVNIMGGNKTQKGSPREQSAAKAARIIEKGSRILEFRKGGASFRAISAALINEAEAKGEPTDGLCYTQVWKDYREIVKFLANEQKESFEETRFLAIARLDEIYLNYGPYARLTITPSSSENEVKMKMKAGDILIKAIREYAELLGLKRHRIELSTPDGKPLINPVMQVIVEFSNEKAET